jgi:hypothetical protein
VLVSLVVTVPILPIPLRLLPRTMLMAVSIVVFLSAVLSEPTATLLLIMVPLAEQNAQSSHVEGDTITCLRD